MAPLDRRDRVSLAAGGLALAGALTIACALFILHLVAVLSAGVAALSAGAMILVAQRRLGRRLHGSGRG